MVFSSPDINSTPPRESRGKRAVDKAKQAIAQESKDRREQQEALNPLRNLPGKLRLGLQGMRQFIFGGDQREAKIARKISEKLEGNTGEILGMRHVRSTVPIIGRFLGTHIEAIATKDVQDVAELKKAWEAKTKLREINRKLAAKQGDSAQLKTERRQLASEVVKKGYNKYILFEGPETDAQVLVKQALHKEVIKSCLQVVGTSTTSAEAITGITDALGINTAARDQMRAVGLLDAENKPTQDFIDALLVAGQLVKNDRALENIDEKTIIKYFGQAQEILTVATVHTRFDRNLAAYLDTPKGERTLRDRLNRFRQNAGAFTRSNARGAAMLGGGVAVGAAIALAHPIAIGSVAATGIGIGLRTAVGWGMRAYGERNIAARGMRVSSPTKDTLDEYSHSLITSDKSGLQREAQKIGRNKTRSNAIAGAIAIVVGGVATRAILASPAGHTVEAFVGKALNWVDHTAPVQAVQDAAGKALSWVDHTAPAIGYILQELGLGNPAHKSALESASTAKPFGIPSHAEVIAASPVVTPSPTDHIVLDGPQSGQHMNMDLTQAMKDYNTAQLKLPSTSSHNIFTIVPKDGLVHDPSGAIHAYHAEIHLVHIDPTGHVTQDVTVTSDMHIDYTEAMKPQGVLQLDGRVNIGDTPDLFSIAQHADTFGIPTPAEIASQADAGSLHWLSGTDTFGSSHDVSALSHPFELTSVQHVYTPDEYLEHVPNGAQAITPYIQELNNSGYSGDYGVLVDHGNQYFFIIDHSGNTHLYNSIDSLTKDITPTSINDRFPTAFYIIPANDSVSKMLTNVDQMATHTADHLKTVPAPFNPTVAEKVVERPVINFANASSSLHPVGVSAGDTTSGATTATNPFQGILDGAGKAVTHAEQGIGSAIKSASDGLGKAATGAENVVGSVVKNPVVGGLVVASTSAEIIRRGTEGRNQNAAAITRFFRPLGYLAEEFPLPLLRNVNALGNRDLVDVAEVMRGVRGDEREKLASLLGVTLPPPATGLAAGWRNGNRARIAVARYLYSQNLDKRLTQWAFLKTKGYSAKEIFDALQSPLWAAYMHHGGMSQEAKQAWGAFLGNTSALQWMNAPAVVDRVRSQFAEGLRKRPDAPSFETARGIANRIGLGFAASQTAQTALAGATTDRAIVGELDKVIPPADWKDVFLRGAETTNNTQLLNGSLETMLTERRFAFAIGTGLNQFANSDAIKAAFAADPYTFFQKVVELHNARAERTTEPTRYLEITMPMVLERMRDAGVSGTTYAQLNKAKIEDVLRIFPTSLSNLS